jgi:phage terminase large subunit
MALMNPALRDFWAAKGYRNRVLYGGRSSSKSHDAAGWAIYLAHKCKMRFLCARQFQNKIEESVYTLLKFKIEQFGLQEHFEILQNKIRCITTGSEFVFYGLWRQIDEIKSLEGIDICWIEEAHNLSEHQWQILEPTVRKEGSQFWVVFNPRLSSDFAYQRFVKNPPPKTITRHINYDANPFLSGTMLDIIEAAKLEDEEEFLHVYGGEPKTDDEESVIKRAWLTAAIDAHKSLGIDITGQTRVGYDIADAGEDACATITAHGQLAMGAEVWKAKEDELLQSCMRVWTYARDNSISLVIYDAIGVGASAGAKFNELNANGGNRVEHQKFFAGGGVAKPDSQYARTGIKNKDYFSNIKAQAWWLVADRLRNTYNAVRNGQQFDSNDMLFLDSQIPHLEALIDELCTPKRAFDNAGRVIVESKKDLKKRDVASPNLADAFIMAFLPREMGKKSWFG